MSVTVTPSLRVRFLTPLLVLSLSTTLTQLMLFLTPSVLFHLATSFTDRVPTEVLSIPVVFSMIPLPDLMLLLPQLEMISGAFDAGDVNGVSDAGAFVLAETARKMHCWGENPVVTAKLQLNGQDRFSEREGTYPISFSLSSTTLDTPTLVSMSTPSPFALRSTSPLELATSPELTTPLFSLLSLLLPSLLLPPLRFVSTLLTTMSFVS